MHRIFLQTPATELAWLVIVAYFVIDVLLRNKGSVASFSTTKADKHSTLLLLSAFACIVIVAEILSYVNVGQFSIPWLSWLALVLTASGLILRVVSMRQLRTGYTRTLKVDAGQSLMTTGLYGVIRHPGYLGSLLVWLFFGLAIGNYLVFTLALLLMPLVYAYRIRLEEQMLADEFGQQYVAYKRKSWRLIPLIW
ncbi:methyltransferase family protein [Spirosoma pomorum]